MSKKILECVEYLSVDAPLNIVTRLEDKQKRYIREYAKSNYVKVVGTVRRNGMSPALVKGQLLKIAEQIRKGRIDGVIVANTGVISNDIADAYAKVGIIASAGGAFVSVDEGLLRMNIREERSNEVSKV